MSPRIETTEWIRPTTAARLLGVTRARVQQLIRAKALAAIKIDGVKHVRRADVVRRRETVRPPARKPRKP